MRNVHRWWHRGRRLKQQKRALYLNTRSTHHHNTNHHKQQTKTPPPPKKKQSIHDRGNSGSIGFPEFTALHEFLSNVQASFEYFDARGAGRLSHDDVGRALAHAGASLFRGGGALGEGREWVVGWGGTGGCAKDATLRTTKP
jgi:hypothetical protein